MTNQSESDQIIFVFVVYNRMTSESIVPLSVLKSFWEANPYVLWGGC